VGVGVSDLRVEIVADRGGGEQRLVRLLWNANVTILLVAVEAYGQDLVGRVVADLGDA
jgi:hypothetical protein